MLCSTMRRFCGVAELKRLNLLGKYTPKRDSIQLARDVSRLLCSPQGWFHKTARAKHDGREAVCDLNHALQAAGIARQNLSQAQYYKYHSNVTLASYLHDIGHTVSAQVPSIEEEMKSIRFSDVVPQELTASTASGEQHDLVGAYTLYSLGLPIEVWGLVLGHVEMKRYLAGCAARAKIPSSIWSSPASTQSLADAGGAMSDSEQAAFRHAAIFKHTLNFDHLLDVRHACDKAKDVAVTIDAAMDMKLVHHLQEECIAWVRKDYQCIDDIYGFIARHCLWPSTP